MAQITYGANDVIAAPCQFYSGANVVTGFNIVMTGGDLVLAPSGTLATGTVTLPLNPPEGARVEISSTQTQTAITINANTGDSILGTAVTALVANTRVAYKYQLAGSQANPNAVVLNARTWVRCQ
jgi:hypothetical protein